MKIIKIVVSLVSLLLLSSCATLPYKDLTQYNVILNCKKVNIINTLSNESKVILQKSNFGFNTNEGRMVYETKEDGEYQYAQYRGKEPGKVFYNSVSEDIILAVGDSKYGTYIAMNYSNITYTFFDCTKR